MGAGLGGGGATGATCFGVTSLDSKAAGFNSAGLTVDETPGTAGFTGGTDGTADGGATFGGVETTGTDTGAGGGVTIGLGGVMNGLRDFAGFASSTSSFFLTTFFIFLAAAGSFAFLALELADSVSSEAFFLPDEVLLVAIFYLLGSFCMTVKRLFNNNVAFLGRIGFVRLFRARNFSRRLGCQRLFQFCRGLDQLLSHFLANAGVHR